MATPPPRGQGLNHQLLGVETGALMAPEHALGKGKRQFPHSPVTFDLGESSEVKSKGCGRSSGPRLPKTDFPRFSGENPKLWKKNAKKYFGMYQVAYDTWAQFASLHFTGNATLWLQTYEELHCVESWAELCVAVNGKFGRDKYQHHLEELENLKQYGSVEEYYNKFEELMHLVLVYNKGYDETFFVTRFMGGLKPEIKIAIKLHKPRTVDVALSLAQTQEELLEENNKKNYVKGNYRESYRSSAKAGQVGKGILGPAPEEGKKIKEKPKWEDVYESLKAARKTRGECFKMRTRAQVSKGSAVAHPGRAFGGAPIARGGVGRRTR